MHNLACSNISCLLNYKNDLFETYVERESKVIAEKKDSFFSSVFVKALILELQKLAMQILILSATALNFDNILKLFAREKRFQNIKGISGIYISIAKDKIVEFSNLFSLLMKKIRYQTNKDI